MDEYLFRRLKESMQPDITYVYQPGNAGLKHFEFEKLIDSASMLEGSRNFNLAEGVCRSRGGTKKWRKLAQSEIIGLFVYNRRTTNSFVTVSVNGKIRANGHVLKSGLIIRSKPFFLVWNDSLIIFTQYNKPQVWNGILLSTYDLPDDHMPADWITDDSYPNVVVIHGSGNSERAWAIGAQGHKKTVYYSKSNDGISEYPDWSETVAEDFSNAGFLYIETDDYAGLTSLIDFGNRLFLFSNKKSYIVTDSSLNLTEWGYVKSQINGGCACQQLLCKTENDLIAMMSDGTIYSITAVQSYGDYKMASLTAPAGIDSYISKNVALNRIDQFHCLFDPVLRVIKFFMVRKYEDKVSFALTLFIDKGVENGWMLHDNQNSQSGYNASTSTFMSVPRRNILQEITGDYSGDLWSLENRELSDEGFRIPVELVTPMLAFDNMRATKTFKRGYLDILAGSKMKCQIQFIIGRAYKDITTFYPGISNRSRWGHAQWGIDKWGSKSYETIEYMINHIGISIKQKISFNVYDDDNKFSKVPFSVSTNMIDYRVVSTRVNTKTA